MKDTPVFLCADDFGFHSAVDAAILKLASKGRLSATSCLVDGPTFEQAAPILRTSGLQCGLHLNFTESFGREGTYMPLTALMRACWLRRLDPVAVREQIASQLYRFSEVMGCDPDFVDGHQHVHQFPQIREALMGELNQRYRSRAGRPWLRSTLPSRKLGSPQRVALKAAIIAALGGRLFQRLAQREEYRTNLSFLGVYDFRGGSAGYAMLLKQWFAAAEAGTLIMCHPASAAVPNDALGQQRCAEFEVLASAEVAEWLQRYGLRIAAGREGLVAPE